MKTNTFLAVCIVLIACCQAALADISRSEANNGNLVMEDIPGIPQSVVSDLNRYQNVRYGSFQAWTEDGEGIFVTTRFGNVSQIHHVGHPGGARTQITFFDEPAGSVSRQPNGSRMVFTMDAGGSEFSQIFLLDPAGSDDIQMLTDGESRNGFVVWDRSGEWIAYQSTRRNGSSNDVWMMDVNNPESAGIVLESPDGTYWYPSDFSPDNQKLLIQNYVGNADSRIHLLDLKSGEMRLLAGSPENPGRNMQRFFLRHRYQWRIPAAGLAVPGGRSLSHYHHGEHTLACRGRRLQRRPLAGRIHGEPEWILTALPDGSCQPRVPEGGFHSNRPGGRPGIQTG
jgi:Tol biopolymer transport system component